MGYVKILDDLLWAKQIEGDSDLQDPHHQSSGRRHH